MDVGKYTYGHEHIKVLWGNTGSKLVIGKFCSIADNITVFLGGNHSVEWITTFPFGTLNKNVFSSPTNQKSRLNFKRNRDVIIGNDVWIGGNVTIMSGVKIGDGAVIARNSHVVSNVKPYSVVGGNPAQFYYYRFPKEAIKKFLEIKWWDFDDQTINIIIPVLCSGDYKKFIEICEEIKVNRNK